MRETEKKAGSGNAKRSAGGRRLLGAVLVLVFSISAGILYHQLVAIPEQNREMTEQLKEDFPGEGLPEGHSPTGEPAGEKSILPLVDLAALMEQYPDVRGWISIPDTGIDYPVLQSGADDPQYYLRRNYKGEYDVNGSIFLQWDCNVRDGQNLVVYGHNMKSGVMFGKLDKYADPAYCKEHPAVLFQTPDGVDSYAVVAVLKADVSMFPFRQTVFQEPDGLSQYLSRAKGLQLFENGQMIGSGPKQVLTMVTCSYEWDGARNIVIAVRE